MSLFSLKMKNLLHFSDSVEESNFPDIYKPVFCCLLYPASILCFGSHNRLFRSVYHCTVIECDSLLGVHRRMCSSVCRFFRLCVGGPALPRPEAGNDNLIFPMISAVSFCQLVVVLRCFISFSSASHLLCLFMSSSFLSMALVYPVQRRKMTT
jgi:hypothetical protein